MIVCTLPAQLLKSVAPRSGVALHNANFCRNFDRAANSTFVSFKGEGRVPANDDELEGSSSTSLQHAKRLYHVD